MCLDVWLYTHVCKVGENVNIDFLQVTKEDLGRH